MTLTFENVNLGETFEENGYVYRRTSEHNAIRLDTGTQVTFNAGDRVWPLVNWVRGGSDE